MTAVQSSSLPNLPAKTNKTGQGLFMRNIAVSPNKVVKRNGKTIEFKPGKIAMAVSMAALDQGRAIRREWLTEVVDKVVEKLPLSEVGVEEVQEAVVSTLQDEDEELALIYQGYREKQENNRLDRDLKKIEEVLNESDLKALQEACEYLGDPLKVFQHFDKSANFIHDLGRRELPQETYDRSIAFLKSEVTRQTGVQVDQDVWDSLYDSMLNEQAFPSSRLVQMAGPAAARENLCIYNCSASAPSSIKRMVDALYIMMQGTGYGFSVERKFVSELPVVPAHNPDLESHHFVVPDSTEGWCDAMHQAIECGYEGRTFTYDLSQIRPSGARLKTKPGTASGPEPLRQLLEYLERTFRKAEHRQLTDLEVHDLMCFVGSIVQVGGVRRAAEISLSDLDSATMRGAKSGSYYLHSPHRGLANNSATYWGKPDARQFMQEWMELANSGSGERGIINRKAMYEFSPDRRKAQWTDEEVKSLLVNPCSEAILLSQGLCNLTIAIVRPDDTEETLMKKVRLAAIFGTFQSALVDFHYVEESWKKTAERERLLGVDLLGALDCKLFRSENQDRGALLRRLRDEVVRTNKYWAEKLGIPQSVATTVIKPGGNSGARFGTGQSMAGWPAEYLIRSVQVKQNSVMDRFLTDQGVPRRPCPYKDDLCWFSFPLKAPEGAQIASDVVCNEEGKVIEVVPRVSAIEQLETWMVFFENWAEHSVSATIYVGDDEWIEVGNWVYQNFDRIAGLSFLPRDNGVYDPAPFTPITKSQFEEAQESFPDIDWAMLFAYEHEDSTELSREFACTSGSCNI